MKRVLALVLLSVSLSIGATLLVRWLSLTVRPHRGESEASPEEPVI
jgi:hypothetical protein